MKYHPIDKTRALQSPGWPEDTEDSGDQQEPKEQDDRSDDVILISDPIPAPVVTVPRWPTPAMRKMGMTDPSVISSLKSLSQQSRQTKQDCGEGPSSAASSLRNLSDDEEEEEESRRRKQRKKMAKVTTPQKVFGSSPEKRFPALDRLVASVETKMEKRKSSDQGSQCSASKRQRLDICEASPERGKVTERAGKSPKPAQESLQRLLEEEEGNERQQRDETLLDAEPNCEGSTVQNETFKPSNTLSSLNVRPRRSPRERNLSTNEEIFEPSGQGVMRSARKTKQKQDGNVSGHKEQATAKQTEKEAPQSELLVTPEKRHSLAEIQATPIRGTDELERRQKELVRSPSPVISPETRQSLPKDNAVFSSPMNTSTPLRTLKQRTETAETLPQGRSPRATTQPKIKPVQESTKREPGRKALRKTKHLENSSDGSHSVHKQDLNTQATHSDQCAALLMSSELSAEFLGFDLTVSEADRIWQQASGVDASRRALFEESSDKSEIFEIDIGAFQSEGSDWDKPVTGFISAELLRKVSVGTTILSPRDSDKENQEDGRQRLNSSEGKNFYTKDLSGNLLSDVRLRRLELERRFSQGKLSQTRSFCEIAGLPPMPEPPPAPDKQMALPEAEKSAMEVEHKCDDKPPLDLLDHIDQPQVQPGPSRIATKGKSPKNIRERDEVGLEDVESVNWSDCDMEEVQDFRLKVRNPQTNELHILKAAIPIQRQDPFYIMSAPTTQPDQSGYRGRVETGPMSPGVSPKGKVKYKPSPKKVLRYRSKEVLLKSPVKNAYSRPAGEVPESAVRRIMDDLGFQEATTGLQEGYGYQGTPSQNRRLSEVGLTDVEYGELIDSVINSPRWGMESQIGPQLEVSMSSNVDALDLLDDWNTLISEDTTETPSASDPAVSYDPTVSHEDPTGSHGDPRGSQEDPTVSQEDPNVSQEDPSVFQEDPDVSQEDPNVFQEDPIVSQDHATTEDQSRKGSSKRDRSSEDGIWEKLERWVSEGSSDGVSPHVEKRDVGTSPVPLTVPEMEELRKQSSKSPRRLGKSGKQKKQDPNKTQADSNKPTMKLSQKSSKALPDKNSRIQILREKYMNRKRPPVPSRYNCAKGRYRKIMKLPIRRHAQSTRKEKPVKEKPVKKPTRRSPRVILHRLNLQTVQTTAAGDLLVQPVENEPGTDSQAGQQTNQGAQTTRKRKQKPCRTCKQITAGKVIKSKRGRPRKVDVNLASTQSNMASTQTNMTGQKKIQAGQKKIQAGQKKIQAGQKKIQAGQKKIKRKRGRPRKVDVNLASTQSNMASIQTNTASTQTNVAGQKKIQAGQKKIKAGQKKIQAGQKKIKAGQKKIQAGQKKIKRKRGRPRKVDVNMQNLQSGPTQMKPIQSVQNSPHQGKSVGKTLPAITAQQPESVSERSKPVQSVQNSPSQTKPGKRTPVQSLQDTPHQGKSIGKKTPVRSAPNSPHQGKSVGKSPSVSAVHLNRKNLDIPSSPDAVASPQDMTPKRKQMDSPDRWTSPRKKSALPASPEPSMEKKKETPSPNVRRGRGLKKRIPECRTK
ncbi:microtubule-associated protein futsch-like isoform X5 [Branchiostoma lanceolatum]